MEKMHVKMKVNGKDVDLLTEPRTLLIHAPARGAGHHRAACRLQFVPLWGLHC